MAAPPTKDRASASAPDEKVSKKSTAEALCFLRCAYSLEPDPAIRFPRSERDLAVPHFLPLGFRIMIFLMSFRMIHWFISRFMFKDKWGSLAFNLGRAKFVDEAVATCKQDGYKQLVLLGAGMDLRPYRYASELSGVKVFELDLEDTQQRKLAGLKKAFGEVPTTVRYVPINFNCEKIGEVLLKAGFDPNVKTRFIWEGVTYYLDPMAVCACLQELQQLSKAGSSLFFDYIPLDVIDGSRDDPKAKDMIKRFANTEPLIYGEDPAKMENFLQPFGFRLYRHMTPRDIEKAYLMQSNGELWRPSSDFFYLVYAVTA